MSLPDSSHGWVSLRLHRHGDHVLGDWNGTTLASLAFRVPSHVHVGIRGGQSPTAIDRIVITNEHGEKILDERFSNTHGMVPIFMSWVTGLILFNVAIFRRRGADLGPSAILLNGTLLGLVAMLTFADGHYFATRYLQRNLLSESSQSDRTKWLSYFGESVRKQIDADIHQLPEYRVLLLGTSQTFGSGATHVEESWAHLIANRIEDVTGVRGAVLNTGIPGAELRELLPTYEQQWSRWNAQLVIVDLGTNDRSNSDFSAELEELIRFNRSHGTRTLFVLEPNSPEGDPPGHEEKIGEMRRIAEREDVPVVDMNAFFKRPEIVDSGFAWLDFVHLTSYGNELFAEELLRQAGRMITRR